ncbi:hypothetical protein [Haloferula sp.]|uniref:hypothetical protein n=1 Tax=Haloferula sp. TaxID=2497595 RepID=UPI003C7854D9
MREKLLLVSPVLGGVVLLVVMIMRFPQSENEEAIRQRVNEWEIEYALSQSVAKELLEIEKEFHLSESFFSFGRSPTPEEVTAHQRAIKSRLGTDESSH